MKRHLLLVAVTIAALAVAMFAATAAVRTDAACAQYVRTYAPKQPVAALTPLAQYVRTYGACRQAG